jgi:predicted lipoprotein with Yx(FWY)xxD motif
MKQLASARTLAIGIALSTALLLVAAAQASRSSHSRARSTTGALVALRKTALGSILVDARGRTLYLFERDRDGVSMCGSACIKYWPPLASHGTLRAGRGVHQSLLRLTVSRNGRRQVTYAGHPLYRFVGDKRAGQTAGEGLDNFGAEWYALGADGRKVDKDTSASSGANTGSGSSSSYGGW